MIDDAEMAARIDALAMDRFEASRVGAAAAPAPSYPVACADCGVRIPSERLQIMPGAKRCVRCQARLEN